MRQGLAKIRVKESSSMDKNFNKGLFWILIATVGFSIIPILAKLGFKSGLGASTVLFYRYLIAFIVFNIFLKIKGIRIQMSRDQLWIVIGAGLIYALQCLCYFSAFNYISASVGAILYNSYPVFVIILSKIFLKDVITRNKVVGVLIAILGTVIILYAEWETPQLIGITLIFLTAFISSIYMVYNKKTTSNLDTMVLTMYICLVCTIVFFIHSIISGEFQIPTDVNTWVNMSLLAVWSTIIGLYGFMKAIALLNVGLVSIINLAEPIFTIILSYLILSESLTFQQIIGSIVVISGIYVYENMMGKSINRKKKREFAE